MTARGQAGLRLRTLRYGPGLAWHHVDTMSRNPMPADRWDQAMSAAGHRCQAPQLDGDCAGRLVVHHRKVRGMGGSRDPSIHDLANLAVLCDAHHVWVHANPAQSYELGLLVRR